MLRDLLQCEQRVYNDLHASAAARDPVSDFVKMLWEGGLEHEKSILSGELGDRVDLREVPLERRASETRKALQGSTRFILGALLVSDDRVGMPDLLEQQNGMWIAGDVKSGSAFAPDGRRPRLEYAVQVAHYAELLASLKAGTDGRAFVIGRDRSAVSYDLRAPYDRSGRTIASITAELTEKARAIRDRISTTKGALSSTCKLCHWHTLCERDLTQADDLTLVAGVGRSVRDSLSEVADSVAGLAELDISDVSSRGGKTTVRGIGVERLTRFRDRARLLRTPGAMPYALQELSLSRGHREIHFDVETDPTQDTLVYLHGFLIREPKGEGFTEQYHHIFAESCAEEGDAFAEAMRFLSEDPKGHIYYYSKYERSSFRTLADRHPKVCSREDVDRLFDRSRATDLLFDVIMPHTEWPTANLSIKTLARRLGFDWRDTDASGAASIAWFNEYARTRDPTIKRRILDYNEDDVRASAVVLDGLRALPISGPPTWPPPLHDSVLDRG
jgi:predicted RecB family nuclease